MTCLRSHPHLFLGEHVDQVLTALAALVNRHSFSEEHTFFSLQKMLELSARLHDTGKGNAAFQEYIPAPEKYRSSPDLKTHTPLSLAITLGYAAREGLEPLLTLALSLIVSGHHHGLDDRNKLTDRLCSDKIGWIIGRQSKGLDLAEIAKETGVELDGIELREDALLDGMDITDNGWEAVDALSIQEAISYRLFVQLVFSFLLEADKAFLAVAEPGLYLASNAIAFAPGLVDKVLSGREPTPIDPLRQAARLDVISAVKDNPDIRIATVNLPTGLGKTAVAANWALMQRNLLCGQNGITPKIIVVLPFLSIIDQTEEFYRKMLEIEKGRGKTLLPCHSLSDRSYDSDVDGSSADFFIDTWRSEIIVTTFDQFLMALMEPRARHQMRFHNLYDSVIIMDEVQTLPCKLWDPISHLLRELTDMGNCRILAMSATLPGFLYDALELVHDYTRYFKRFGRYRLVLKHVETISLKEFADNLVQRLPEWQQEKRRVLITLNTRKSARMVRDELEAAGATPLYFLSADVTPGDRLEMIDEIKRNNPCIVVSTQCIEAGVDIDLDLVFRDFAPLDSIIQVAGRCNRNSLKDRCDVELFSITNDKMQRFSDLIYDQIHLNETRCALDGYSVIPEEEVIEVCNRYFEGLTIKKDTGKAITKAYARWEEMPSVRELLRGKDNRQYRFIVIEQDPELKGDMEEALAIKERWERRRALRNLAGRIARISVSVYANGKFNPADIARPIGSEWLLDEGLYEKKRGLVLPDFLGGGTMIL